ncbi:hypothetical protein [Niveispirillum sp. BGYR6]|uniref:hypothetical protein n=1 Tax=Niveispirillum sp. BGYR6 TaxID=2971249 RepID=UPI0022B94F13|nr:hypothetical protein [Niveispirillum sp. BGYR6]MDG5497423.1 hypothetical protein [Niveispirillum sp. BGYR6]
MTHWLMRAYPFDPALGTTRTVYASLRGWVSEPDEQDAAPNTYWDRRIDVPMTTHASLWSGDAIGGRSSASYGAVQVANQDGGLDHWLDWAWDGRSIELWRSEAARPRRLSDFTLMTRRTVEEIVPGDMIELVLTDLQARFTAPARRGIFAGTGGAEGGDSLKGRAKPFLLGRARRFEPLLIDADFNIYMIDPAGFRALLAADDGGAPFTIGPDVADYAALKALSMASLDLATAKGAGLLRLSEKPRFRLRVDAEGVAPDGSWIYSAAQLARHAAMAFAGLGAGDIDHTSVNALHALQPAVLGHWSDGGGELGTDALIDRIMESIGGHWGISAEGLFQVGRYDLPAATPVARFTRRDMLNIVPQQAARRIKSVRLSYRPGLALSEQEIAQGIPAAVRELATQDREWTDTATSPAVAAESLLAEALEKETGFDARADALAERDRLLALLGARRQPFDITLPLNPATEPVRIGDTIDIQHPRYGLANGRRVVVLRRDADTAPAIPTLTLTVL